MSSDWRDSANKRRDERQAKVDVRPPGGSKKDTKRWCKGKVGVEHKPVCVDYYQHKRVSFRAPRDWKLLICTECNRDLDYWWPSPWDKGKAPPDWVKPCDENA